MYDVSSIALLPGAGTVGALEHGLCVCRPDRGGERKLQQLFHRSCARVSARGDSLLGAHLTVSDACTANVFDGVSDAESEVVQVAGKVGRGLDSVHNIGIVGPYELNVTEFGVIHV